MYLRLWNVGTIPASAACTTLSGRYDLKTSAHLIPCWQYPQGRVTWMSVLPESKL